MNQSEFNFLKKNIETIIHSKKEYLPINGKIEQINIEILGSGRKRFFQVTINSKNKFVFRISGNKEEIEKEFSTLENLFEEIAPSPIYIDTSGREYPFFYLIESYIEGKTLQRWFERHIILFARKLAELHKLKINFDHQSQKKQQIDLWEHFIQENDIYFTNCPQLIEDKDLRELLPNFQNFLLEKQELFDNFESFSAIHGNLSPQNILFNETQVYFTNWEKSRFFDNARDFSGFFYEDFYINGERIKLEDDRKELLIDNYLRAYWRDPTFKQRLEVWQIFDMMEILVKKKYKYYNKKFKNLSEIKEEISNLILSIKKSIL